jgi:hypothetical protein
MWMRTEQRATRLTINAKANDLAQSPPMLAGFGDKRTQAASLNPIAHSEQELDWPQRQTEEAQHGYDYNDHADQPEHIIHRNAPHGF